ncbi:MAG: hypothetical protein MHM6MM_009620, partial [Cercozoa sp. M6MM]
MCVGRVRADVGVTGVDLARGRLATRHDDALLPTYRPADDLTDGLTDGLTDDPTDGAPTDADPTDGSIDDATDGVTASEHVTDLDFRLCDFGLACRFDRARWRRRHRVRADGRPVHSVPVDQEDERLLSSLVEGDKRYLAAEMLSAVCCILTPP